jgi:outer membrane autotransporter protein
MGGPGTRLPVRLLLTTSSVAALIAATAPQPAAAACPTTISGAAFGCTNNGTITGINISSAIVTGNVSNAGTISPNGINVTNSTINGAILDSGNLAGGIRITDSASQIINATGVGISITGPFFSGGISNAGTITAFSSGIAVVNVSSFGGGISNSGTISSQARTGISIVNVSTFTGDITNSGTITATTGAGISISNVKNFSGNIVNDSGGAINAATGISLCACNSIFSGNIINKGTISASFTGIRVEATTFTGGITNSGTITATGGKSGVGILVGASPFSKSGGVTNFVGSILNGGSISGATGIVVDRVSTFTGDITNSGTITAAGGKFGKGIGILVGTSPFSKSKSGGVGNFVGNILNSGSISGTSGIVVSRVSTFTGGITNSGSITAPSGVGIGVTRVNKFTGDIVNDSGGTINAAAGLVLSQFISTFSGNIINKGVISASGTGIVVDRVSTFTGGITNSGSITAPNVIGISVSGVNSFVGDILNDSAGTINAATGISLCPCNSTFSGSIINKGIISASRFGIVVEVENFTGGITNSGTITSSAAAATILVAGGSLFSGNIVNGGTLAVSSGVGIIVIAVSTFAGSIINGGSITATSGVGISVSGVNSFSGDIVNDTTGTINGAAGITLCSCNPTFTGNIINKGTISASRTGIALSVGTFTGGITNTGTIVAGGTGIFSDVGGVSVFNSGTINAPTAIDFSAGGGGNILTLGPGSNITGLVLATGNNDTLQLGGTGGDSFNVSLIGTQYQAFSTFNKVDGATWTLTGSNSAVLPWNLLSGTLNVALGTALPNSPFTVQAGILSVDGTVGAVTLNGGTLKGNGTLGALTVGPGGTVAPGHSIGQLNVNGPVSFGAGSFYQVEANAAGQADKIVATGQAKLTGGTVQALPQIGAYGASTTYTILTAGTGVSGTFAGVTSSLPYLIASLSYDANDAFLTLTRNKSFFQNQAGTPNQTATASALDTLPTNNGLFLAAAGLTGAATQRALDALSGEIHASLQTAIIDDSRYMRSAVLDRLRQSSYGQDAGAIAALGWGGPVLAYAASPAFPVKAAKKAPAPESRDVTFWAQGFDARAQFDGNGNAAGVKRDLAGLSAGADARLGKDWRAGIAAGYSRSNIGIDDRASSAGVDTAHLAAYAGTAYGAWKLRTGAAAAWHEINTNRTIAFPGFFDQVSAKYTAASGQIFGEVGYGMTLGMFAAEPFGGLAFVHLKTGSFGEAGGGAALAGFGNTENVGYSSLGLRVATFTMLGNGMALIPRAAATWQHAFGDVVPSAALAFQSAGIGYNILGVPLARDAALVEAGLDLRVKPQITFGVGYSGELAGHVRDHAVKGKFLWAF